MFRFRVAFLALVGIAFPSALEYSRATADDEGQAATFDVFHPIYDAVHDDDLPQLRRLLDRQPHLVFAKKKTTKSGGSTLLHLAASFGHVNIARELIRRGARVNAKAVGFNELGGTPLHHAAARGRGEMVLFLMEQGAKIDEQEPNGWTALQLATLNNHVETAQILVKKGIAIDVFSAAGLGKTEYVRQQLERDASIAKSRDGDKHTPLHYAASCGNLKAAEILLGAKLDVNARNRRIWGIAGSTPLNLAASEGHVEMVELLLKHGADVNAVGRGFAALHHAVRNGNNSLAKLLLRHGADVNAKDEYRGWTPLHMATYDGHVNMVRLLLDRGADVNAKADRVGGVSAPPCPSMETPLDLAVKYKKVETVKVLIEYGGLKESLR